MSNTLGAALMAMLTLAAMAGMVYLINDMQTERTDMNTTTEHVDPTVERIVDCEADVVVYRGTVGGAGMTSLSLNETSLERSEVCP